MHRIFLVLCVYFLFHQPLFAAAQDQPYWYKASKLIETGDYAGAYLEVQDLLQKSPDNVLLLRVKGVCLLETGQHDAAVQVLRHATTLDPESIACKYYLGQALAYRGSVPEAMDILQMIVSDYPETDYGKMAAEILPQLKELEQSTAAVQDIRRWSVYGALSSEYDDNITLRAKNSSDEGPTDSMRITYSFYGELRLPDQKIDPWPFTVGIGYSLYGTEILRSELSYYDLFSNNLSLFVEHNGTLFDKFYSLRFDSSYTDTRVDWTKYSNVAGLQLSFGYQWHKRVYSKFLTAWDNRRYENDSPYPEWYSQDGEEYRAGIMNYLYLFDNSLVLGLNYTYRKIHSEGDQNVLRSNDLSFSVTKNLPFDIRIIGVVNYSQEDYPDYFPDGRLDDIWAFSFSLEKDIWECMMLNLNYTYGTADSDEEYTDYRRNVVGLTLTTAF